MNLKKLEDKSILLFGKSRAFNMEEFRSQLKFHKIKLLDEFDKSVVLVVDGKMMTPYEQNESEELYKNRDAELEFIEIDTLEKELAKHIDADTLLMSLKLSRDKERLKSFIKNSMIDDELFFKLLKMYSWRGEDFFENDDNRDVSAAIILRFYKNIERNHNVQYATSGLTHLIVQTNSEKLIEAISLLEPLQTSFDKEKNSANRNILSAIAAHVNTPKSVLKSFVKKPDSHIKTLIAMRTNCDEDMQEILYNSSDKAVKEALSYNHNLSRSVIERFLQNGEFVKNIARYIKLDDELFELFFHDYSIRLSMNETLTPKMQERLLFLHVEEIMVNLATNTNIDIKVVGQLLQEDSKDILAALYENPVTPQEKLEEAFKDSKNHLSLANNESTPKHILRRLGESFDTEILKALAANPSTPVETLYQLHLDSRLARAVKENPSFGRYIQQENIGWEV
mgnify:CR=1 FL=1